MEGVTDEMIKFLKLCKKATQNDKEVLKLVQKRFNKADDDFINSQKFLDLLSETSQKIRNDRPNTFVHLKAFLAHFKSDKRKRSSDTDSGQRESKRRKSDEPNAKGKKDVAESCNSATVKPGLTEKQVTYRSEVPLAVVVVEDSNSEDDLNSRQKPVRQNASSSSDKTGPRDAQIDLGDKKPVRKIRTEIITDQKPEGNASAILKRLADKVSDNEGNPVLENASSSDTTGSEDVQINLGDKKPVRKIRTEIITDQKPEENTSSVVKRSADEVTSENEEGNSVQPKRPRVKSDPMNNEICKKEENKVRALPNTKVHSKTVSKCDSQTDISKNPSSAATAPLGAADSHSNQGEPPDEETERDGGEGEADAEEDEVTLKQRKCSERQLKRLEALLENISSEIKRLEERELTLDELDDEDSGYTLEDRYKKKFVKVWNKYCEVAGRPPTTGRAVERKFKYEGTRYPEINVKIEKFIMKSKDFPDYNDIRDIIQKCNAKYRLRLTKKSQDSLAREVFLDVGTKLQKRRQADFSDNIWSTMSGPPKLTSDPALFDSSLRTQLDASQRTFKSKMDAVLEKYSRQQEEYIESEDEDEEEEDENENEAENDLMIEGESDSDRDSDEETNDPKVTIPAEPGYGVTCDKAPSDSSPEIEAGAGLTNLLITNVCSTTVAGEDMTSSFANSDSLCQDTKILSELSNRDLGQPTVVIENVEEPCDEQESILFSEAIKTRSVEVISNPIPRHTPGKCNKETKAHALEYRKASLDDNMSLDSIDTEHPASQIDTSEIECPSISFTKEPPLRYERLSVSSQEGNVVSDNGDNASSPNEPVTISDGKETTSCSNTPEGSETEQAKTDPKEKDVSGDQDAPIPQKSSETNEESSDHEPKSPTGDAKSHKGRKNKPTVIVSDESTEEKTGQNRLSEADASIPQTEAKDGLASLLITNVCSTAVSGKDMTSSVADDSLCQDTKSLPELSNSNLGQPTVVIENVEEPCDEQDDNMSLESIDTEHPASQIYTSEIECPSISFTKLGQPTVVIENLEEPCDEQDDNMSLESIDTEHPASQIDTSEIECPSISFTKKLPLRYERLSVSSQEGNVVSDNGENANSPNEPVTISDGKETSSCSNTPEGSETEQAETDVKEKGVSGNTPIDQKSSKTNEECSDHKHKSPKCDTTVSCGAKLQESEQNSQKEKVSIKSTEEKLNEKTGNDELPTSEKSVSITGTSKSGAHVSPVTSQEVETMLPSLPPNPSQVGAETSPDKIPSLEATLERSTPRKSKDTSPSSKEDIQSKTAVSEKRSETKRKASPNKEETDNPRNRSLIYVDDTSDTEDPMIPVIDLTSPATQPPSRPKPQPKEQTTFESDSWEADVVAKALSAYMKGSAFSTQPANDIRSRNVPMVQNNGAKQHHHTISPVRTAPLPQSNNTKTVSSAPRAPVKRCLNMNQVSAKVPMHASTPRSKVGCHPLYASTPLPNSRHAINSSHSASSRVQYKTLHPPNKPMEGVAHLNRRPNYAKGTDLKQMSSARHRPTSQIPSGSKETDVDPAVRAAIREAMRNTTLPPDTTRKLISLTRLENAAKNYKASAGVSCLSRLENAAKNYKATADVSRNATSSNSKVATSTTSTTNNTNLLRGSKSSHSHPSNQAQYSAGNNSIRLPKASSGFDRKTTAMSQQSGRHPSSRTVPPSTGDSRKRPGGAIAPKVLGTITSIRPPQMFSNRAPSSAQLSSSNSSTSKKVVSRRSLSTSHSRRQDPEKARKILTVVLSDSD